LLGGKGLSFRLSVTSLAQRVTGERALCVFRQVAFDLRAGGKMQLLGLQPAHLVPRTVLMNGQVLLSPWSPLSDITALPTTPPILTVFAVFLALYFFSSKTLNVQMKKIHRKSNNSRKGSKSNRKALKLFFFFFSYGHLR
jgi:hypothetical protein